MSQFIFDTDTLSEYQREDPKVWARVTSRLALGVPIGLAVTSIEEQVDGWQLYATRAKDAAGRVYASDRLAHAVMSWRLFTIHPLSEAALDRFDRLVRAKLNVGRNDLKIAAIALDLGSTVVTRNRRDFGRVPGLPVEDWSV